MCVWSPTCESSAELPPLPGTIHTLVPDHVELFSGGLTELLHVLLLEFVQTTHLLTQLPRSCAVGKDENKQ